MTHRRVISSLALLLFSCASGGGGQEVVEEPSLIEMGNKVRTIEISLDEGLADDQRSVIEQYTAIERLHADIEVALGQRAALAEDGTLNVHVVIDGFQLRSNGATIWVGSMAGADFVNVTVSVTQDGELIKSFQTNTSSIQGGIFMAGRTKRLNRLTASLGERVANGI
jgi:hypothetical protein